VVPSEVAYWVRHRHSEDTLVLKQEAGIGQPVAAAGSTDIDNP
jgi:hypothetical protein